jgi:hypothetical protein
MLYGTRAGRNQTSGDYRGVDDVLGLFGKLFQLTDGTFRVEIHDVLASDEPAVVLARISGERAGRSVQNGNYAHVCHFREGKLSEAWIVDVDPYANEGEVLVETCDSETIDQDALRAGTIGRPAQSRRPPPTRCTTRLTSDQTG